VQKQLPVGSLPVLVISISSVLTGHIAVADCRDDLVKALVESRIVGIGHAVGDRRVEEVADDGASGTSALSEPASPTSIDKSLRRL